MSDLPHFGQALRMNARLFPDKIGARDLGRQMTFRQWNARACRLANALVGLGLAKGDRVAVLAYNRIEWLEIYAATAKAGLVCVPVNFRLMGPEIRYIVENSEARALIVEDALVDRLHDLRGELDIPAANYICIGHCPGYREYEDVLEAGRDSEPDVAIAGNDPWALMYTSGTTGKPKGAIRSHHAGAMLSVHTDVEMGFGRNDAALLVMPMCHANSLYFMGAFTYVGASSFVYNMRSIDPEHLLRTISQAGASFTSLVPTHYIMLQALPEAVRNRYNVDRIRTLLVSSAPARRDTKQAILEMFKNSGLYELYGSTEAGWVTMLHPNEQFDRLGSVGKECAGTGPIRLLDADGNDVKNGEVGELYSNTPYTFDGYWKLPEKTREAFRGNYCTVGDMARREADGYYYLVDRKSNMIISGGENIYPSEVENLLGSHGKVKEVAVIGTPDDKWGERVHAVIVLHDGCQSSESEIIDWCRDKIAGYKRPRSVSFIRDDEMPRTATGKIQHRILKTKMSNAQT
jgi:acyl-CoA synthetase (AMP-forming)/AMP-acid ligase II